MKNSFLAKERQISLGIILAIIVVVFLFVTFIFIQIQTEEKLQRSMIHQQIKQQTIQTENLASNIETDLQIITKNLDDVVLTDDAKNENFSSEAFLEQLRKTYYDLSIQTEISSLTILDKNGIVVNDIDTDAEGSSIGLDLSFREFVTQTKNNKLSYFSNGFSSFLTGEQAIVITYPIIDDYGNYVGLDLAYLPTIPFFNHYGKLVGVESQSIIVSDRENNIIFHPDKNMIGQNISILKHSKNDVSQIDVKNSMSEIKEIFTTSTITFNQNPVYYVHVLTSTDAVLLQSNDILSAEKYTLIILVALISILLVVLILFEKKAIISKEKTKNFEHIKKINKDLSDFKHALDDSASVAVTDAQGIITYANDMFCKLSQYSQEELVGKTHRIIKSDYHNNEFYENLWDTITSGKPWQGDIKNKAKDGTFYWVRTNIMPIFNDNDKITNYIAIRIDITSQVELAKELAKAERMSSIGQLASRMSHDIRNPLSIIQISLENLKLKYGTDEFAEKSFDKVGRSIGRITHQIDNVLDFVREQSPKLEKTMCSEIITESLDSLTISDDIQLILPKNDVEIFGDKKQLSIACNNLILNAIQAIDGKGTIEIIAEENKDAITIQVKDSGKGIPKENIDKIFELLYTTKQQGTGLGLSSVKAIIESHGGTISVTSPPTIFRITLPKTSE